MGRISTGSNNLDKCLGGGFESGIITELYGEPGSGKTNVIISTLKKVLESGKAILIDTEGISWERVSQVGIKKENLSNLKYARVKNYDEQVELVGKLKPLILMEGKVDLIVVDNLTTFYRYERERRAELRKKIGNSLYYQLEILQSISNELDIPVIITNQVYYGKNTSDIQPLGGEGISHAAKAIFKINKMQEGRRELEVIKHRSLPEGLKCPFKITNAGIE